jgi:predicted MFS family arabinose efflux permease
MAGSYRQLFISRAAVGIGEAGYGSVSPSFVSEYFPKYKRGRILALFSMAIPVGSALGYVLGGAVGFHWGWRKAFFLAGIPGFVLAVLAAKLKDPRISLESARPHPATIPEYATMTSNRSLVFCTLSMAAMTFGLGGYAVWMPAYFTRAWGMNVSQAGTLFGSLLVVGGIIGSLCGGWIADYILRFNSKAYFLVSGVGLLLAFPLACASLFLQWLPAAVAALLAAETCAFLNMGPLNAVIVSVTQPNVRSMAFAANIFVIHALGDAVSPYLIGYVSDIANLRTALALASISLGVAGVLCFYGARYFKHDASLAEAVHA